MSVVSWYLKSLYQLLKDSVSSEAGYSSWVVLYRSGSKCNHVTPNSVHM